MSKVIAAYTYLPVDQQMMLTYEDGTTETFTEADAARYVELTGRPRDAESVGWSYTPTATEDPNT
jgi:hypothetical protein